MVPPANISANLDHRGRDLGLSGSDRGLADGDAFRTLAAKLQRHGDAKRLSRCLLLKLCRHFGIEPFFGHCKTCLVDRAGQARGGERGICSHRVIDGLSETQRRRKGDLPGGGYGD